jgi:hypothetical protein
MFNLYIFVCFSYICITFVTDQIMSVNGGRVVKDRPTTPVISESQKFVRARIERRWLMLFKQTAEFMDRQKPRVTAPEVVEDVMLKRRLQRSEAAWKVGLFKVSMNFVASSYTTAFF